MPAALTRAYGEFAADIALGGSIPPAALDVASLGFTDCAGVLLAGRREDVVNRLARLAFRAGQGNGQLLLGQHTSTAATAALINSTAAHAHDFDDFAFSNHPSAVLVPAILAASHEAVSRGHAVSGRTMLAAYVAGYEVWADLMRREPDPYYSKGWHPTAVLGPVGAAVAGAVVFGLDGERARHAVALACSFASGVFENFGTMAKPLHGGRAAESGVTAVLLAAEGIEASAIAVESGKGLLVALSPQGRADRERVPRLGVDWFIVKERLNIKKYPTVGASQRCIDAVLLTLSERRVEPGKVRKIVARVSEQHLLVMPFRHPKTGLEAKFSLEFCVACALLHGRVGLREVSDPVVRDAAMQAMIGCVEIETTRESLPDWPAAAPHDVVTFHLDDGTVIESPHVHRATGHGDTPIPVAQLRAKFDGCAAYGGVGAPETARLFAAMQSLAALAGPGDIPVISS